MKVHELVSALRSCDPNAKVFVASWRGRYGPLCRLVGDAQSVRLDVAVDSDDAVEDYDQITPERLIECGGKKGTNPDGTPSCVVDMGGTLWARFTESEVVWLYGHTGLSDLDRPRNMGEVWQLLERCGLPVKKGGKT